MPSLHSTALLPGVVCSSARQHPRRYQGTAADCLFQGPVVPSGECAMLSRPPRSSHKITRETGRESVLPARPCNLNALTLGEQVRVEITEVKTGLNPAAT